MNLKSIINLFSILILFFSASYIFPIIVSAIFNDGSMHLFIYALIVIGLIGLIGFLATRGSTNDMSNKEGFIIIVLFWIVLSIAGSIPFTWWNECTDSIFESMSGITTTGATVISNLDAS